MMNGFLSEQTITKNNKQRIYCTILKRIVIYGSGIWPMKKQRENMLTTAMEFSRRAAERSRMQKLMKRRTNVKHTPVDDVKKKQLIWYGQRTSDDWSPRSRRRKRKAEKTLAGWDSSEMKERNLEMDCGRAGSRRNKTNYY